MLLHIPKILTTEQVAECRLALDHAAWIDGRVTAGHQSERVKNNQQLPETDPTARKLGDMILNALERHPLFVSAALPQKIVSPLFNRYSGGQTYGTHIDGAIRTVGTAHRMRTDLSITLFLAAPEDYDGGELTVEDVYGVQRVKLPAGDGILYPGSSRHRIEPVTRGTRLASFFWVQSMVRDDGQRKILFELDELIQHLSRTVPDDRAILQLTGIYHNLLRKWADA